MFVFALVAGCSAAAPRVSADADPQEPEPTPVKPDATWTPPPSSISTALCAAVLLPMMPVST